MKPGEAVQSIFVEKENQVGDETEEVFQARVGTLVFACIQCT